MFYKIVAVKSLFIGIFGLGSVLFSNAQSTTYDLKSCLDYGLANHPGIKAAGHDIGFARARANEGISQYLPQINASGGLDYNIKLQTTVLPGGIFGPDPTEVRFGTKWIANGAIQLDQKIFDLTYIMGYTANKPSVDLNRKIQEKVKEDVAFDIASNYQKVLIAKEQIKLLNISEANLKKILDVSELQLNKGILRQTDYDRIKVQYNNVKSQVFIAESGLDLATNALKMSMGMPASENISIQDSVRFDSNSTTPVSDDFVLDKRLDYNIINQSIWLQNVQLKMTKAAYSPSISAYARYGGLGQRDDFNEIWKNFTDFSSVGLRLHIPIFDGLYRNAKVKQQKYSLMKEKENLELYKLQFEMQFKNARFQLERSKTSLLNDLENLELAQSMYEQTSLQYEKGVATLSDLLNAEMSFNQARNNYITSVSNVKLAELEYEKAKGTLMTYLN